MSLLKVDGALLKRNQSQVVYVARPRQPIYDWQGATTCATAQGYIGALWAVDDAVAAEFATHYYKEFQSEVLRGLASPAAILMLTRKSVYESTGNPTALAYILLWWRQPNIEAPSTAEQALMAEMDNE